MSTLASLASFSGRWTSESLEDDFTRWVAFLAANGVAWAPRDEDRAFVRQVLGSGSPHAGRMIELRLCALAHQALKKAGDARTLVREASGPWYLLSAAQLASARGEGLRLSGPPSPWAMLATIPLTLGAYVGAKLAADRLGLAPEWSWAAALVVYVATHRVVRGRWPLQPET